MNWPTARKYLEAGRLRTNCRPNGTIGAPGLIPLAGIWPAERAMLLEAPGLEAKVLFEHLWSHAPSGRLGRSITCERSNGGSSNGGCSMGRTRRCFFVQDWVPGHAQCSWTGPTLSTSWGSRSEDRALPAPALPHGAAALELAMGRRGVNRSRLPVFASRAAGQGSSCLGRVTRELRVDNSSAATHRVGARQRSESSTRISFRCARTMDSSPEDHRDRVPQ